MKESNKAVFLLEKRLGSKIESLSLESLTELQTLIAMHKPSHGRNINAVCNGGHNILYGPFVKLGEDWWNSLSKKLCFFMSKLRKQPNVFGKDKNLSHSYIQLTWYPKLFLDSQWNPKWHIWTFAPSFVKEQNQTFYHYCTFLFGRINAACMDEGFIHKKQSHVLLSFLCLHSFWKHYLPTQRYCSCQGGLLWSRIR